MRSEWDTLRYAGHYVNNMGFSVIPIKAEDKRPAIKSWLEYQTRKATNEELIGWFADTDLNIGIVTGSISGITVVDVDPDADTDRLDSLLGQERNAPSVTTPRGGRHLYFDYYADLRNKAGALRAVDIRGDGGYVVAPPSVGVNGQSYQWNTPLARFTHQKLPDSFVQEIRGLSSVHGGELGPVELFTLGRRDEDIFHVANALIKGGASPQVTTRIILTLAAQCKPAFPQNEALEKIKSAIERANRRERNLTQEIKDWINQSEGYFSTSELMQFLQVFDKAEKNKVYMALSRLRHDGFIEKAGVRHGVFRRVVSELEAMDWMNADCTEFDVKLPLGLNEFVEIYPNNITVVAGTPDSGKTALLMNIAKDNMNQHEVHYFNSEMGVSEFRKRMMNHREIKLSDWKIHAWSRAGNFSDCIDPKAINIIDFLEITDAFYKVSEEIDDIYRKLDGGLAFIGLQKGYGQDLGRGGTFSLEKPRLYLAMDYGKIKIVKAKNWRDPSRNPNGMTKEFKLAGGASFIETTGWNR